MLIFRYFNLQIFNEYIRVYIYLYITQLNINII